MSMWMHLIPGYTITKAISDTVKTMSNSSSKSTPELEEMGRRVEIESSALQAQAKVEQELAIARRIMCADTVEIEEFYDASGSGGAGVTFTEGGIQGEISGNGRKIVRRVIKFNGFNEKYIQEISSKDEDN